MSSKIFKGNSQEIKQKKGKVKVIIIIFISTAYSPQLNRRSSCELLTLTRPNIILSCTYLIAALASHSHRLAALSQAPFPCSYSAQFVALTISIITHVPYSAYPVPRLTLLPFSSALASAATLYLSYFPFFLSLFLCLPFPLCQGSTNHCDRRSQPYWQHLLLFCCYS